MGPSAATIGHARDVDPPSPGPSGTGAPRRDPETLFQRLGGRPDGTSARLGRAQQPPTPGVECTHFSWWMTAMVHASGDD